MKICNLLLILIILSLSVVVGGCGSKFQLTSLELSPEVCLSGDAVTVSATLTYSGDVSDDYEAELRIDGTLEETQTFTCEPGSSQLLSFTLTKNEPGSYAVQLGNLKTSLTVLGVGDIQISPDEVEVDQPVTVTADLQNVTGDEVIYYCCLFCQGKEVQSKDITMAADSTSTVTFTLSKSSAGQYEVELLGLSGSFKVLKPAEFVVRDFDVAPNPVEVGGMTTITASIENVGEVEGTDEVSLLVDGVVEETKEITLVAGAVRTETFTISKDSPGSYSIQVGGQQATLKVGQLVRLSTGTIIVNEMTGGDSWLSIYNETDLDLVVLLSSPEEPEIPLLAFYVRAHDSYVYKRVKPGSYIFYYTFGEDWDDYSKTFLSKATFMRSLDELEFTKAAYRYSIWKITFGAEDGEGESLLSLPIGEESFPPLD